LKRHELRKKTKHPPPSILNLLVNLPGRLQESLLHIVTTMGGGGAIKEERMNMMETVEYLFALASQKKSPKIH